jgi:hypothetical protein
MLIKSPEGNYRVRKNKEKKKGSSNIQYQLNYFKIFFCCCKYLERRNVLRVVALLRKEQRTDVPTNVQMSYKHKFRPSIERNNEILFVIINTN